MWPKIITHDITAIIDDPQKCPTLFLRQNISSSLFSYIIIMHQIKKIKKNVSIRVNTFGTIPKVAGRDRGSVSDSPERRTAFRTPRRRCVHR